MPITFLSDLTLQDCMGSGSFGIVFAAQTADKQHQFAVKFIHNDCSMSDKERWVLERECKLSCQLPEHRNVVRVFDSVETLYTAQELKVLWISKLLNTAEHVYRATVIATAKSRGTVPMTAIKMELCGKTLFHWLHDVDNRKTMTYDQLHLEQFKIISDLAEGLKFLHSNDIMHRDIKPSNVMFSFSTSEYAFPLKLGDFGLCRLCSSDGRNTSNVGSIFYMAPEVTVGLYGKQCDVYSFGLVVFEVIQLTPSVSRIQMFESLTIDKKYELVNDPSAFPGLKTLIINMTMRSTEERLKSMDEFELSYCSPRRAKPEDKKQAVDLLEFTDDVKSRTGEKSKASRKESILHIRPPTFIGSKVGEADQIVPTQEFADKLKIFPNRKTEVEHGNENTLFQHHAEIFIYDTSVKKWKKRGEGNINILQGKGNKVGVRVVMCRANDNKLICNHSITADTIVKYVQENHNHLMWNAIDQAEGKPIAAIFSCRFATAEKSAEFKITFEEMVSKVKDACQVHSALAASTPLPEIITKLMDRLYCSDFHVSNKTTSTKLPPPFTLKPGENASEQNTAPDIVHSSCSPGNNFMEDENEDILFEHRARVYRFDSSGMQWKERGVGRIAILKEKNNGVTARIVMWRANVETLACNHWITSKMKIQQYQNNPKIVFWSADDFSQGLLTPEIFTCVFSNAEKCAEFKKTFGDMVPINYSPV